MHFKKRSTYLGYHISCVVVVNSEADPTIEIYNTSVVKIYNAMSSLVRFEKNFSFYVL
jgi:hypothetical protein